MTGEEEAKLRRTLRACYPDRTDHQIDAQIRGYQTGQSPDLQAWRRLGKRGAA